MKWRVAPLGAVGLCVVVGVNAWLLIAVASEVVSDRPAATNKVDWDLNLSGAIGNAANRGPMKAISKSWHAPFSSSHANRSFRFQRHRQRL